MFGEVAILIEFSPSLLGVFTVISLLMCLGKNIKMYTYIYFVNFHELRD